MRRFIIDQNFVLSLHTELWPMHIIASNFHTTGLILLKFTRRRVSQVMISHTIFTVYEKFVPSHLKESVSAVLLVSPYDTKYSSSVWFEFLVWFLSLKQTSTVDKHCVSIVSIRNPRKEFDNHSLLCIFPDVKTIKLC